MRKDNRFSLFFIYVIIMKVKDMQEKINKIIWGSFILLTIGFFVLFIWNEYKSRNALKAYNTKIFYMDTYIYINVYSNNKNQAKAALEKANDIYQYYHQLTNRFEEYKDIHNLYYIKNNSSKKEYITLDPELYNMIKLGKEWYQKSNHLIDISMGNVIDVWKEYRSKETGIPTIKELKKAHTDTIDDIILKENKIKNNHVNIDLGCLAKGYATDKVATYFKSQGIDTFLINAGGNVLVGNHYQNDKYKVGIENPTSSIGDIYTKIKVNNKAIVTSGGYERFYEYKGKKYHHVIHPDTLFPNNDKLSVTIISNNSTEADLLSTMLFLMSTNEGKKYVDETKQLEATWYISEKEQIESSHFKEYVFE